MESNEEYQGRVASAVLKAIADTALIKIDGTTTAYIRSSEVCDALITALAVIMEGASQCRTRKGMKAMSEAAGRNLLTMMRQMKKLRAETGVTAFNATVIYQNSTLIGVLHLDCPNRVTDSLGRHTFVERQCAISATGANVIRPLSNGIRG